MGEFVNLDIAPSGVGTIRLNRPKVNALNRQVAEEIREVVAYAKADVNCKAVVVWGGERVFAAGADIKEMGDMDPVRMFRYIGDFQDVFTQLQKLPVVTIAAINGFALGGGCELALACDLRIASEDAHLGQPEILLGVIPGAGGTQRLPRLIGPGRAKELIYSGRFVGAEEAERIGLVNKVVPSAEVYSTALEWAVAYAKGPSVALAAAKQVIDSGLDADLTTGLMLERQAFAGLFATEDQKIGMKTFAEKGPGQAEFKGR